MKWLSLLLAVAAASALLGCGDPVLDARIEALGGEKAGVPHGEFHRPGQPCTFCHSDYGSAPAFSLAGTIFGIPAANAGSEPRPVDRAVVTLTDTTGTSKVATTNCVGSFFFRENEYVPQYPLHVVVEANVPGEGHIRKVMGTRIDRASSCAECHFKEASEVSPGWVWVFQDPLKLTKDPFPPPDPQTCKGAANFR